MTRKHPLNPNNKESTRPVHKLWKPHEPLQFNLWRRGQDSNLRGVAP